MKYLIKVKKATIGNAIKVEVKEVAARSGITHLEGVEDTEWSTPACKKINIKVVKSFADKHKSSYITNKI